jgi:O-antigen/teichoic acid export membrane protein
VKSTLGEPGLRRSAVLTVLSFGGGQVAIAVSALIRIPLTVAVIGTDGLGLVFVLGAITPALLATAAGVRGATRAVIAERLGAHDPSGARSARASTSRTAWSIAAAETVLGIAAVFVLPLSAWFDTATVASQAEVRAGFVVTILLCAIACPAAVWWGLLEGHQRVHVANVCLVVATLIGLPLTVLAAVVDAPFLVFAALNAGTSTGGIFLCWLVARRGLPTYRAPAITWAFAARRAITPLTVRSFAEMATRGIDPLVIGAALGPTAVGSYGVAQRLSLVVTLVPSATAPLLTSNLANRRGGTRPVGRRTLSKTVAGYAAIGALVSCGYLLVGPFAARVLDPANDAPWTLFVALALTGVAWSALIPLASATTGPDGLKIGMRVDVVMGLMNVALSIWWVNMFGIAGPAAASFVAVSGTVWTWWLLLRRRSGLIRETHEAVVTNERDPEHDFIG